ncbi:MAG TPA: 3' terminal RNA ribose 2'-O-methyltransferase Hen1 [Stackebrandtia sp.]|uniref:3' terminal RNA ribose 2'-O-methyltransferase Hen1 n=1 Tax=Stackebrandtia sp. TaxID=2023065 RepID=UPI002D2ECA4A|nr:3' terminal RNA ribose 2'-O-methyltransferase Hen1 [Stackebrandtia sp.]HZE38818.1 3' terminal RNA ribose 2'-O-methyltransferase Hen1 [Stackebrandtia sp.]
MTISTTHRPATDLGYLLYKHPDKVHAFSHSFGAATVVYPEATEERCTAALVMEVDPVKLTRSRGKKSPDFSLGQYVNDRPYAASSLLAVAIGNVFSTARNGRCDARAELAASAIPLEVFLAAVPCKGGAELAEKLFAPLGWDVEAAPVALDESFPDWGESRYVQLRLKGTLRVADALNHLYVLLPVLDDAKHYWVDIGEVDKLVRNGGEWLAEHPCSELITRRYLARQRGLERVAFARLAEVDESAEGELEPPVEEETVAEEEAPKTVPLAKRRHAAVLEAVAASGASSVIDLGCGSGRLVAELLKSRDLSRVTGVDVSTLALKQTARYLKLDRMSDRQSERVDLFQGALTYTDERFGGYDAAILMEVIEHIDPPRLAAVERVVFGEARPSAVIVTTPNVEYNVHYELEAGCPRHRDHRFEWDRAQFAAWAERVAAAHGYRVAISGIGDEDVDAGQPTQMGVFSRD